MKLDQGDPFKGRKIDPDLMKFKNPDFGFNNHLIFEDSSDQPTLNISSNWRYLLDYTSLFPRFERVNNYI